MMKMSRIKVDRELQRKGEENRFDEIVRLRKDAHIHRDNKKLVLIKGKRYKIRCQKRLKSGKQCSTPTRRNDLFCKYHKDRKMGVVSRNKMLTVVKNYGIYGTTKKTFLDEELKEVQALSHDELMDMSKDVHVLTSIINKLLKEQPKETKDRKGRILISKQQAEIKLAKSLQYAIMNLASVKKMFFDVKFSDTNTITRNLFNYVMSSYKQILVEEIKDVELLKKIAGRMQKLGMEIQRDETIR